MLVGEISETGVFDLRFLFIMRDETKMTDTRTAIRELIRSTIEGEGSAWGERGFFIVELACRENSAGGIDEITVTMDCDGADDEGRMRGVGIDDCALLNREVTARLEAEYGEGWDCQLTVMSAGLGQPLKLGRQYQKLIRQASLRDGGDLPRVDVLFKDGKKLTGAVLCGIGYDSSDDGADAPSAIEVAYTVKELVPGKKRKTDVEHREQIRLADTKAVSEHFDFK